MLPEANFNRLANLEQYAPGILKEFARLVDAPALLHGFYPTKLQTLQIKQVDAHNIDAFYFGINVRFQLVMSYGHASRARGRVLCLYKYSVADKTHFDLLGEFTFSSTGDTDLPPVSDGSTRTMGGSADEIVLHYLDKAIESGPNALAKQN
jgi:hypothetical protein